MGLSLANAFLAHYEQIWLNDCPDEFKPVYYKRYVDDIFVLFRSPHRLEKFNEYLNTKHANIKFANEKEVNRLLPFSDVLISRNNKGFTTTVYHKPTFSGVYFNFNSFTADEYKNGLIYTLLFRIFSIVSDFSKFHLEVNYLKNAPWRRGVVVITTAQLHSTKPELRFCAGSNPARGMSEIGDGEDL